MKSEEVSIKGSLIKNLTVGPAAFYPLVLRGTGWEIKFQSKPEKKVVVKGEPNREELIEALCHVGLPVIMIPMVEAIYGGVEVKEI